MSWEKNKEAVDSALGALLMSFMAIMLFLGSLIPTLEFSMHRSLLERGLFGLLLCWTLATEGWLVWNLWRAILARELPVAPTVAGRLPKLPFYVRIPLGLWWFFHFLMGSVWFVVVSTIVEDQEHARLLTGLFTLLSLAFSWATYGYLLLTARALTRNKTVLWKLWRFRKFWALLVSGTTLIAGLV